MTDTNVNLRAVVLDILMELEKPDTFIHIVLKNALIKYQYLDKNERSFITRLAQGTVEKRIELDYILNQFSKTPVKKMKKLIKNVLEMSVYQLKYMDGVPESAVCNEAVKLAKKRGFQTLSGYVNGVLRNTARNLNHVVYPDAKKEPLAYLSITSAMPEWILQMWSKTYDYKTLEQIIQGFNANKKTFIRCNTNKVTPEVLKQHLASENVTVKAIPGIPFGFEISGYDYLNDITAFTDGEFQVQDISSMLAGIAACPETGNNIIDVCAAPGGKSINVALLAKDISVEARDLSDYKVQLIDENIERLEIRNITTKTWDAVLLDPQSIQKADIVIADLPCSGLGIMGRKPDIRFHSSMEKIESLQKLQREILSVVWQYVKPGGYLIYSTCTISALENEENVSWLLENYPFTLCPMKEQIKECVPNLSDDKMIQLLPGVHGTDGFFMARLKRNEETDGTC